MVRSVKNVKKTDQGRLAQFLAEQVGGYSEDEEEQVLGWAYVRNSAVGRCVRCRSNIQMLISSKQLSIPSLAFKRRRTSGRPRWAPCLEESLRWIKFTRQRK